MPLSQRQQRSRAGLRIATGYAVEIAFITAYGMPLRMLTVFQLIDRPRAAASRGSMAVGVKGYRAAHSVPRDLDAALPVIAGQNESLSACCLPACQNTLWKYTKGIASRIFPVLIKLSCAQHRSQT